MRALKFTRRAKVAATVSVVVAAGALATVGATAGSARTSSPTDRLDRMKHIVVVYEENHSFDNLYGTWEHVRGLSAADAQHTVQVKQTADRAPYACLLQLDVNLTAPDPLSSQCSDTNPNTGAAFQSHFFNDRRDATADGNPFPIDRYITPESKTCPDPSTFGPTNGVKDPTGLPGGCTRDLVHRYYQEQYQIDGGRQDRYTTGSDAAGLTQGYYDSRQLPIYRYLHQDGSPHYAISDDFFQGAFGGSFLNHQWLIAARTPFFTGAPTSGTNDLHSITDTNGMPNNYALYKSTNAVKDSSLTEACPSTPAQHDTPPRDPAHGNSVCGDWAINTTQPPYQPYSPGTADARRLPPQTAPTIGDRLSGKGVSWAWYSGGWSNADGRQGEPGWTNQGGPVTKGTNANACPDPNANPKAQFPNCPDNLFQYHHQPFNYFASFAPGTAAREQHLRDEQEFLAATAASRKSCELRQVSFVKPIGSENEHPGYASEPNGSDHLVDLIKAVEGSACAKDTMIVVTYDEFGGSWDHVPPPGQGGAPGPHDAWGPGTRIPALTVAPFLHGHFVVDHQQHDTTSILSTIEHRFDVAPVNSRDAAAPDMSSVFAAHEAESAADARAGGRRHGTRNRSAAKRGAGTRHAKPHHAAKPGRRG